MNHGGYFGQLSIAMKTTIAACSAALLLFAAFRAGAGIIAGPITNPNNGHDYYLLTPNTWTASEAEAEDLGGTLAVIKNAAEQEWVFSTFGSYGGTNRNLWIGLHRQWQGGPFVWVTQDVQPGYVNWADNQPDNGGGIESCVQIIGKMGNWPAGKWNDLADNGSAWAIVPNGVIEVPGKSNEKSLTEKEKSLIGTWYESGNPERAAWITGTKNLLFLITHDRHAARLIFTPDGFIFDADRIHGEIADDKIVWGNGTWWSRRPAGYRIAGATSPEAGKTQSPANPANAEK